MFEKFYNFYNLKNMKNMTLFEGDSLYSFADNIIGFNELMFKFQGVTFGKGEYRLHYIKDIKKWNDIVCIAFPEFKNKIECFGYDWLGRQFALYKDDTKIEIILMFEPGTGSVLEIPTNFVDFHNNILINNYDACVAFDFYQKWLEYNNTILKSNQCVGYKIPLFLGGKDSIDNLELVDMEVYWYISAQLIIKTK